MELRDGLFLPPWGKVLLAEPPCASQGLGLPLAVILALSRPHNHSGVVS